MSSAFRVLRFTAHCLEMMAARGVSEEQVELAVESPDCERAANRPGAVKIEKALSKRRRLGVVIERTPGATWPVTVFWMKKG